MSGLNQRFTKPSFPYRNREFESRSLRRLKLPVRKANGCPAPSAREWAKDGEAKRRIGTEWEFQNGRICHELGSSFRFFERTI